MPLLVLDRREQDEMIRERQRTGADRHDEVWDGVYVMSPIANPEHQQFIEKLTSLIRAATGFDPTIEVHPGTNVSDRDKDWTKNYRVPDVAVILPGGVARVREGHVQGGPDFLVEVVSDDDRSREKFDFYAAIGVRELMIVDRHPWALELYRLADGRLGPVGRTAPGDAAGLTSEVLPIAFRLVGDPDRPSLEVRNASGQVWTL